MSITIHAHHRDLKCEDRHFHFSIQRGYKDLHVMAVLDGHGGNEAVLKVTYDVKEHLQSNLSSETKSIPDILRESIRVSGDNVKDMISGCVLTILIYEEMNSIVHVGNIGDVGAFLINTEDTLQLHTSHRLSDSSEERSMITERGGVLQYATDSNGISGGPLRVWPGGLAVSRSLGDNDCPHVSKVPSITSFCIPTTIFTIVLGSDGVWDALNVKKVRKIIRESKHNPASRIVDLAWRKRALDDISCIVLQKGIFPTRSFSLTSISSWLSMSSSSSPQSSPSPERQQMKKTFFPVEL